MDLGIKQMLAAWLRHPSSSAEVAPGGSAPPAREVADLVQRELEHFKHHYHLAASERDALLNERNALAIRLQVAERAGGLKVHGAELGKPAPFPADVLPGKSLPRIVVVDIGAQELTTEQHAYQPLVDLRLADVIGFEPLEAAAEKRARNENDVKMLNYFVGDGSQRTFHVNKFDATSSLFATNYELLDRFESLSEMCRTVHESSVLTTRLDDVAEITDCDFLKIDVQGGELDVLKGAPAALDKAIVVHCEVEFSHVYKDQPLFGEVDAHLRAAGFEMIDIVSAGYATARGLPRPIAQSRLLWGEAIYFRSPASLRERGVQKTAKAALIAHANYRMYDIAAEFLNLLPPVEGHAPAAIYADVMLKSNAIGAA